MFARRWLPSVGPEPSKVPRLFRALCSLNRRRTGWIMAAVVLPSPPLVFGNLRILPSGAVPAVVLPICPIFSIPDEHRDLVNGIIRILGVPHFLASWSIFNLIHPFMQHTPQCRQRRGSTGVQPAGGVGRDGRGSIKPHFLGGSGRFHSLKRTDKLLDVDSPRETASSTMNPSRMQESAY